MLVPSLSSSAVLSIALLKTPPRGLALIAQPRGSQREVPDRTQPSRERSVLRNHSAARSASGNLQNEESERSR